MTLKGALQGLRAASLPKRVGCAGALDQAATIGEPRTRLRMILPRVGAAVIPTGIIAVVAVCTPHDKLSKDRRKTRTSGGFPDDTAGYQSIF